MDIGGSMDTVFYGDMDLDTETAAGASRDEDIEVRFLRRKGMLLPSLSLCPGYGYSARSQPGHIRTADSQVGGAWGLGTWTSSRSRTTVPVLDNLLLGHHGRET